MVVLLSPFNNKHDKKLRFSFDKYAKVAEQHDLSFVGNPASHGYNDKTKVLF